MKQLDADPQTGISLVIPCYNEASRITGVVVEYIGWDAAFYFASGLFFLGFLSSLALPGNFAKPESQTP